MDASLRRGVRPRALLDLYEAAEEAGCEITLTRKSHFRISTPQGLVFGSQTASDHRTIQNLRSQLRRNGVDIP